FGIPGLSHIVDQYGDLLIPFPYSSRIVLSVYVWLAVGAFFSVTFVFAAVTVAAIPSSALAEMCRG
ncbi:hypothetical protein, partial [Klebsiella pneumoniae]|uniref:hypothetical protein n=1 Tax=Klebsiella pneumoniae TaxID=573 RepID=UPI00273221D4